MCDPLGDAALGLQDREGVAPGLPQNGVLGNPPFPSRNVYDDDVEGLIR